MFERFTDDARKAVNYAQHEARLMRHGHIGTEHLLIALAGEPEVAALGLDTDRARAEVVKTVGLGDGEHQDPIPFTAAAKEAMETALNQAMRMGQQQIRPGHLLLAVLNQRDGVARRILVNAGATPSDLREVILNRLATTVPGLSQPTGSSVLARLDNVTLGAVGDPWVDARLLVAILERNGEVAAQLRRLGLDETQLRRMYGRA